LKDIPNVQRTVDWGGGEGERRVKKTSKTHLKKALIIDLKKL